jgi:multidrug transporter EmrE-like cation transporter
VRPELAFILAAALLEVGGDALLRAGLHAHSNWARLAFLASGSLSLIAYGLAVNTPEWDFGRLLGIYVAAFFLVSQAANAVAFHTPPNPAILWGGVLILAGGFIIARWG